MGDLTISGAAITVIGVLVSALVTTVVFLFKLLMSAKDSQYEAVLLAKDNQYKDAISTRDARILELNHETDSLRAMAKDFATAAEQATNKARQDRGEEPLKKVPDVVPEHRSPVTPEQEAAAELATLRARQAVLASELGMQIRTAETIEPKSPGTLAAEKTVKDNEAKHPDATTITTTPDAAHGEHTDQVIDETKKKLQLASDIVIEASKDKIKEAAASDVNKGE